MVGEDDGEKDEGSLSLATLRVCLGSLQWPSACGGLRKLKVPVLHLQGAGAGAGAGDLVGWRRRCLLLRARYTGVLAPSMEKLLVALVADARCCTE